MLCITKNFFDKYNILDLDIEVIVCHDSPANRDSGTVPSFLSPDTWGNHKPLLLTLLSLLLVPHPFEHPCFPQRDHPIWGLAFNLDKDPIMCPMISF